MELQDWSILKPLKSYFLKSVRTALVFGKSGSEALLLTRDDQVFGIGTNLSGHLGVGDESPRKRLTEIPTLCGKGVKGFAYGGDSSISGKHFVVAYLNNNEVYQWGSVPGSETPILEPNLVHQFDCKVEKVACGDSHCVVLCENGQVYTWGTNEKGQLGRKVGEVGVVKTEGKEGSSVVKTEEKEGSSVVKTEEKKGSSDTKPVIVNSHPVGRVKGLLDEAVVIQISCGAQFTVALINDGRVVSWGCNDRGQLGFSSISSSAVAIPTEIPELKKNIRRVACGRKHVIALCTDWSAQFWGDGEVFRPSSIYSSSPPAMLPIKLQRLRNDGTTWNDIGASYLFDFFVTVNEAKQVCTYGTVDGVAKSTPNPCHSVYEAFNKLVSVMPEPLRVQYRRTLVDTLINSFENQKYCDFVIEVEGKEFHVHKAILMMRSPYFETVFTRWFDPKLNVYSIEGKTSSAIEAYLKFIYTDSLNVNLETAIELLLLADEYCDDDFKVICEEVVVKKMTFSNVVDVYPLTFKMRNVEKLNARCIELSAAQPNHLESMVNSDGYKLWDSETIQKFVPLYAKRRRLNDG